VLTAIVLVHEHPADSVPIRAIQGPRADAAAPHRAARFAKVLGLPLLDAMPTA
jgi:hypothetical protein